MYVLYVCMYVYMYIYLYISRRQRPCHIILSHVSLLALSPSLLVLLSFSLSLFSLLFLPLPLSLQPSIISFIPSLPLSLPNSCICMDV